METDESLYQRAQTGSEKAFAELYGRFEKPLYGYLKRRLGQKEDAEEVFHECMLAVVRSSGLRLEPGGFAAWLYQIAANKAANCLRSRGRESRALEAYGMDPSTHPRNNAPDARGLEAEEEAAKRLALHLASKSLTKNLGEVYELKRKGESHEAIAAKLGLPLGTVKSRLNFLVKRLRKEVQKWTAH